MKYLVVRAMTALELNVKVEELINDGYEPVGSHQAVVHSSEERNGRTLYENDYSQTMIKKDDTDKLKLAIEVLECLYKDAEMAISGEWNKSNEGFYDQITLIDNTLSQIK